MSECIKIKNGLNIQLTGEANKLLSDLPLPEVFAIKPSEFTGISPKILVKPGDEVLAGSPLFFDKNNEFIIFCSPVSGEIIEVVRAEKRKLLEIKILADKEIKYLDLGKSNPAELSRDGIIDALLKGGLWPLIRQRPFGIIANHTEIPKSIFISAFDTNPLAPDIDFIMQGENQETFQTGLNAIIKLTNGNTHLNINGAKETASIFRNSRGVIINKFSGPHPAGNIGVQINHIDPINKGEVVWYLNPQDVLVIGKLFSEGRYDASRIIALTGSQVSSPKYYKTVIGTSVKSILNDGGLKAGENRIISGNVLSGSQIQEDGFLGYYDTQITVIPEGHESEFMGWLAPGLEKFSMSRTFFSWLNSKKKYNLNTNLHGEERPFVVTGQYEKVFPMDIYPVQLLKSILIEDIEMMEQLGIYEVVEEDFALCEFVCTSKIKSQEIIKRGIEIIQKELN
ncbi:MAG: NADH:ubiquinone reductase (Na(+)-transporting) subunit A [Sphingobacteriales bacterium 17-39-43]|uniref:Na(+)-translocating NADH-quinone reductase subunit A n=1 Tax=Daejeonella sp. TaxID=2805397 RepID=UPI000BC8C13E|nr:Na(+)-translocating NADH-quinone reductase subunit A [Daejeonella sp.]OYZ28876.1 MAG: NADH:ubiquinone reductase (Na(+)-transporting) subunit A [Sphingobacteriales bacterium 16-39-50]OZA22264.1 MAG: NADH:ubiquinone reductase (Na(+)-transporting) subunit A [Sphingobacteriales bacterium 17-39-43]HQT22483.1 Na(+)-translocating NADH-quinone reductase subunit A [Daejeonella sp.]HQT59219.1 Na(+)-translocating NADH-quinone reductase subunit A [Daejeonella sp.]